MQTLLLLSLGLLLVISVHERTTTAFYLETNIYSPDRYVQPEHAIDDGGRNRFEKRSGVLSEKQQLKNRASPRKQSFFEIDIPMITDERQVERIRNNCRMRKEKRENDATSITTQAQTTPSTVETSTTEMSTTASKVAATTPEKIRKTTQFPPGILEIINASKAAKPMVNEAKLSKADIFSSVEFEIEGVDEMTPEELAKIPVTRPKISRRKPKKRKENSKSTTTPLVSTVNEDSTNKTTTRDVELTTTHPAATESSTKATGSGENQDDQKKEETKTRRETNVQKILSNLGETLEKRPAFELTKLSDTPTITNIPLELDLSEFSGETPEKTKRETELADEDVELTFAGSELKLQQPKKTSVDLATERSDRMNNALQKLMTLVNALAQVDSYLTSRAKLGIKKLAKILEIDEEIEQKNRNKRLT